MLYILAALLVLVFFLPDLIGPLPALACGAVVIALAFFIYNLWCNADKASKMPTDSENSQARPEKRNAPPSDNTDL